VTSLLETTPAPHPAVARHARHQNPAFMRLLGALGYGRVFVRARDVWLWDHQGQQYLDALAGFGVANIGHNHPRLVARLQRLLESDAVGFCHTGPAPEAAELSEALARFCGPPLEVSLFASSGSEAVDAALKLARAATRRRDFLSCDGGFHGTSLGPLSIMGELRLRDPFEPLLPGCGRVPFGDLGRLDEALASRRYAAFVVEPLQVEGGLRVAPPGYLAQAAALCRRAGTLFILDEVQTGLGRTGAPLAFHSEGVVPDVVVLAKALSGGLAPVAAAITTAELARRAYGRIDRFDLHGSTFAGGALPAVAALETLAILEQEGLCARAAARGAALLGSLRRRLGGHPLVREIRGRGLLVGIELGPTDAGLVHRLAPGLVRLASEKIFGQWAACRLLERGVICQPASQKWNVLRLEPPLTIGAAECERLAGEVAAVLDEYQRLPHLLGDVARRLHRQHRRGWSF
jgi:putrescine aminotransferase